MSMYLSNADLRPTGDEPGEFVDMAAMAEKHPAPTKAYIGTGITVYWDPARCVHSQRCTTGAPSVFDDQARPWIDPNGAPADEIARVIDTCPSGALSYTRTDGVKNGRRGRAADEDPTRATAPDTAAPVTSVVPVTISPTANGPLLVDGVVRLTMPDGSVEVARGLSLCRCGHSGAKPKCDGSHARVGFVAPGVAPGPQS